VSVMFVLLTISSSVLIRFTNETTIEVVAGTRVELDSAEVLWLLHNGTIILILASSAGSTLHVSAASQNGTWSRVTQGPDDVVSIPTFLVFVEHGISSKPAFAAFAQLPGAYDDAQSAEVASRFLSSVAGSSYDDEEPYICRSQGNSSLVWMVMGVYFSPSRSSSVSEASCPFISTSAACAFMVALHDTGFISVTISNPNRESATDSIVVIIRGVRAYGASCSPSDDGTAVTVRLPSGLDLGGSSSVSCTV
jgi:hypothetical protein